MAILPQAIPDEATLDEILTTPSAALIEAFGRIGGDLLVLGAGGKMGPTVARLARRALDAAGSDGQVIGVSRFTDDLAARRLREVGIQTVTADLLDEDALAGLPDAPNIIFMAGRKFGSTGAEELIWAMNTYLPARVAQRYRESRIVVFSTGNVYPLTPITQGGATESTPVGPIGEYAQSCLGRERMFQYFSGQYRTPVAIIRLNYAIDLRYGILADVATRVWRDEPIDVTMGNVNVIWQGDASRAVLRALEFCSTPPRVLNLAGPETVSIRAVATRFGALLGRAPIFIGEEAPTALLSNAAQGHAIFGYPEVSLETMIRWTADWVSRGGRSLGKPTHYETRDGRF